MFLMSYTESSLVGCYCPRVAAYAFKRQQNNPQPPNRDHSVMVARVNATASPVRGSIYLASPDMGRFWGGAYIYRSICGTLPLASLPLGKSDWWWMVVCFSFSFIFDLLVDHCHPAICQMMRIRRLGIEFPMVAAIRMSVHTRGW